jgi:hypothetical protein
MNLLEIFEELLPIESPFFVDLITKDEATKKVYIHLGVEKTYRPNNDCATIRQYYERTWEHLNLFGLFDNFCKLRTKTKNSCFEIIKINHIKSKTFYSS